MDTQSKIKGSASLYRTLGSVGSFSTLILSIVWAIICLAGLIYFFVGGPFKISQPVSLLSPFTHSLVAAYFNKSFSAKTGKSLNAVIVAGLTGVYFILSLNLICASFLTFRAYYRWDNAINIRWMTKYWTISAIIMGIYEFSTAFVFIVDAVHSYITPNAEFLEVAALMMATMAAKGYFMWGFNLALSCYLFFLHFIKNECPV